MPCVLAVDDEPPALRELAHLLGGDERVDRVLTAADGAAALRVLEQEDVDIVFLDIRMPGLSGLDLARVLARFRQPPAVVFVTAYDDHAVDAFDLRAVDYVMKPYRPERLAAALDRALHQVEGPEEAGRTDDETIPVELGGVTRFVARRDIVYVTAQGDYARLHTAEGSHLLRVPLATLEQRWADAGFVRIHRSHLVALQHVQEIRVEGGRYTVVVGGEQLSVSRRHTRDLRDLLVNRAGG
ncbi:LytR/AlgR family response regulator transcription factor [Ornithinicoccus hortensis]|uniref:LytTR family two component transcriptional regulator n=1 Tax=Ornithinicoccus hortensis TaxID=82346 RepID=A0A542YT01_9MICO|nr:LytTR family DNA-binding domain-containing protein [Ornithinicoccus hortensis]TQL51181.1 LytTR family two component transcriptional regulator [Ornithinicoccus hortensis]